MVLCLACSENQEQQKLWALEKYVWPDIGDINSVERLCVKILPEPQIERWSRIEEIE